MVVDAYLNIGSLENTQPYYKSYEDVLLDYGIDDEELILSLEALESSANDAMEALFLQTGGGY